jgi:hypothetical protein
MKVKYLVSAIATAATSVILFSPPTQSQSFVRAYCFRQWSSTTLDYGADRSGRGPLYATVYHNNNYVTSISSTSASRIRNSIGGVTGDRTWKVVASNGVSTQTCIVT